MCYHRLYIFDTCGHYLLLPEPTTVCATKAATAPISPPLSPRQQRRENNPISPHTTAPPEDAKPLPPLPQPPQQTACEALTHPLQSLRLDSLCAACLRARNARLAQLDAIVQRRVPQFEPALWRVTYAGPKAREGGRWKGWHGERAVRTPGDGSGSVGETGKGKWKESAMVGGMVLPMLLKTATAAGARSEENERKRESGARRERGRWIARMSWRRGSGSGKSDGGVFENGERL